MNTSTVADEADLFSATLVSSTRITPERSPEEVRHLVFRTEEAGLDVKTGQSIRVMAPGQYGNRFHVRLYTIADPQSRQTDGSEFSLCVRRCSYIDDFSGEKYEGVASNYLCNLRPGDVIRFDGPVGLAFPVPENRKADLLMIGMGTGISPFRAYLRHLYEKFGRWDGQIRLFHGARTGLEMLYLNDENSDLSLYFDQKTFKAIQAFSPRPALDAPVDMEQTLRNNAGEVLAMMRRPETLVFIAGPDTLLVHIDKVMAQAAGTQEDWQGLKAALVSAGRWNEVLYKAA